MSSRNLPTRAASDKGGRRMAQRAAVALDRRAAGTIAEAPAPHRVGVRRELVLRDVFGLADVRGGPVTLPEGRA
jgi:hypothetical protein